MSHIDYEFLNLVKKDKAEEISLIREDELLASIREKYSYGHTALIEAAGNGCLKTIKLILSILIKNEPKKLYDHIAHENQLGSSSISSSITNGHLEVLKLLLSLCSSQEQFYLLTCRNRSGSDALVYSSFYGHRNITKTIFTIISFSDKKDLCNIYNSLSYSVYIGHFRVFKILIENFDLNKNYHDLQKSLIDNRYKEIILVSLRISSE